MLITFGIISVIILLIISLVGLIYLGVNDKINDVLASVLIILTIYAFGIILLALIKGPLNKKFSSKDYHLNQKIHVEYEYGLEIDRDTIYYFTLK